MLRMIFHLDPKGRPVRETILPDLPALVMVGQETAEAVANGTASLPVDGPHGATLRIGGLMAEFLAVPADPRAVAAFLDRWGVQGVYPWQDARNRQVGPDHRHAVIGWRYEQEALRGCVRRWLLPGDKPPMERFAQDRWPPAVGEGVKVRLARLSLEPGTALQGTPRQFKLAWGSIERGQASDLPARLRVFSWGYRTDDVLALAWLELFTCVQHNVILRECPLCGAYFAGDGTKASYCPACRTPGGKAKRQRKARQDRPEEEARRAREWNALRMKAVRHAQEGDWRPALELVARAAKDSLLLARVRGLKRGSETYRVLLKAGERLLNQAEINLDTFHKLFPKGWLDGGRV